MFAPVNTADLTFRGLGNLNQTIAAARYWVVVVVCRMHVDLFSPNSVIPFPLQTRARLSSRNLYRFCSRHITHLYAGGLQSGRSQVRFPMRSLDFSMYQIFPPNLCTLVSCSDYFRRWRLIWYFLPKRRFTYWLNGRCILEDENICNYRCENIQSCIDGVQTFWMQNKKKSDLSERARVFAVK
jgi:hypothetical protein